MVVEDPARYELQRERLAVHDDGVAGIVAALVADDQIHVLGEEVGELALPLVAPLGSDHHGRGHVAPPDIGARTEPLPGRSSLAPGFGTRSVVRSAQDELALVDLD